MPTKLPPGQPYANRRPDIRIINCTLSKDAGMLLDVYAPHRTLGRFIERLILEHHTRQSERAAMAQEVGELLLRRKVGV
jgi:hypothetical protein